MAEASGATANAAAQSSLSDQLHEAAEIGDVAALREALAAGGVDPHVAAVLLRVHVRCVHSDTKAGRSAESDRPRFDSSHTRPPGFRRTRPQLGVDPRGRLARPVRKDLHLVRLRGLVGRVGRRHPPAALPLADSSAGRSVARRRAGPTRRDERAGWFEPLFRRTLANGRERPPGKPREHRRPKAVGQLRVRPREAARAARRALRRERRERLRDDGILVRRPHRAAAARAATRGARGRSPRAPHPKFRLPPRG